MQLQTFKEVIKLIKKEDEVASLTYANGIDMTACLEHSNKVIELLLHEIYGEFGADLIFWWLFEDVKKEIIDNDKFIKVKTIEEIHSYLEKNYRDKK